MNPTHIHLLLNHVAILAAAFSVVVFLFGLIRKNTTIKNVAMSGYVLSALAAIPVFLTGEPAEETVETLPGVFKSVIEQHEDAATIAFWLIEITGVLALAGLLLRKIQFVRSAAFGVLMGLFSIISASSIIYTGYIGGMIRHTEIANANANNNPAQGSENGDDD